MAPRQAVQQMVKGLSTLCPSKHTDEVYRDFAELSYCALAKRASPWPEQREKLETQYMEVVGRYRDKDHIRAMPEFFTLALLEIGKGGCDFLGEVAGEMGALDGSMGQYFTPYPVSRLIAEMSLSGASEKIEKEGFITIQEPAAGAGGMLLAAADVIEAQGHDLETSVWFEATELSRSTYHMAYVQLSARGLAGRVICGNSLSQETFTAAYTAAATPFYAKHGYPFPKQKAAAEAQRIQDQADEERGEKERAKRLQKLPNGPSTANAVQLGLFD